MATLEKIRSRAGLLVIVVGLGILAFILGDFLNSGSTYFRQSQERVAQVNNRPIKIQEYQERINQMVDLVKMQNGTSNLPEEYMAQIRENTFQYMVREQVINEESEKAGLTVSPEELFDLVQGEHISPLILQSQLFQNPETGQFDKVALLNYLKTIQNDDMQGLPDAQRAELQKARNFWLFWERNVKQQRLEEKYSSLLTKAVAANSIDAKMTFEANNGYKDIAYTFQPYASVADSLVSVSDSEMKSLYEKRKEMHPQVDGRVADYIVLPIEPSEEDFANVKKDVEGIVDEFKNSENVSDLVNDISEIPYINAYVAEKDINVRARNFVINAVKGDVSDIKFSNGQYNMYKLIDKKMAPDSVKVSHIMLVDRVSEEATIALRDSLKNVLEKGGNFEEIAKQFSVDRAAQNGGELGWFTEAAAVRGMDEKFKDLIFDAPLNQIMEYKSMYGLHLVKVTERTKPVEKYNYASVVVSVTPSSKTYSQLYNTLNAFLVKNNSSKNLEEAANEAGYQYVKGVTVASNAPTLGSIKNSRQVVRWLMQNKKGTVSEIHECDNDFVIAVVRDVLKKGYRSFEALKPVLNEELMAEKKGANIVEKLKAENLSSLDAYATAMDVNKVDTVKFVTFGTTRISGIGVEPKLNAAVLTTDEGQISQPIAGNNGVYVFKVIASNPGSEEFTESAQINNIQMQNAYRLRAQAIQSLVNKSEVVDNRVRFY